MTAVTLKKVGDDIRARLKAAERSGELPSREPGDGYGWVRYDVRVSNSKDGPKVNITVNGYEWLILVYAQHWGGLAAKGGSSEPPQDLADVASDVFPQWRDGEGSALLADVDKVAARERWGSPDGGVKVGGVTKFGPCLISARATTVTHVNSDGTETVEQLHQD